MMKDFEFNISKYNKVLDYGLNLNLNTIINKATVARYLLNGSYARPGSDHFLKGYTYNNIEKLNIHRNKISDIKEID